MNFEITIGINAVSVLLEKKPEEIERLLIISGRRNRRQTELVNLARLKNVRVVEVSKRSLRVKCKAHTKVLLLLLNKSSAAPRDIVSAAELIESVGKKVRTFASFGFSYGPA